ncbi:MAG: FAD-dependent oxidoreductase [Anaerolineae bacterium]
MSKGALIIGGSVAGVQAALDLANSGIHVDLIEASPFLGNGGTASIPGHLLNTRMLEISKHPKINVWTNTQISRAEGQAGRFHVEIRQHPRYVDLAKCTACKDCLEVCPVTVPGSDHKAIYLVEGAQPGCAVIDKLGKAPCSNTCPGGIHVQGYVALIAERRFREALDLIRQAIPFPGICGRICTHPCEINCRRAEVDEAVSIRLLKRFVADWELQNPEAATEEELPPPPPDDARRVAVIGAGPAGMAVAESLVRRGYRVTVFESLPVVGGMMSVGIPSYRLPRAVIEREIGRIERMGVELRLNTPIGPDGAYTLDDLFEQGYEAVFVGVGAHKSRHLRIPGEELLGVVSGIALLKAINLSHQTDDPQWQTQVLSYLLGGVATRVAIIGGGNTAMDVARSLKRLGVEQVQILYRRTKDEMPALPEEIEETAQEGISIEFLASPVRILGSEQGRVTALECVRMKLGEPDASGRRRPVPIAGSEFTLEVDMVVPAIGQAPDLSFLGEGHSFAITREGTFNIDRVSYMTNRPGVFAAGDAITQPVSVIDAIGSAKQAAAGIDAYLRGVAAEEVPISAREVPIAQRQLLPEELAPKPRHPSPVISTARRMGSHAEVELGYDVQTAVEEAQRCLACGPCSECLACVHACQPGAIIHDEHEIVATLDVGAVIYAGEPDQLTGHPDLAQNLHHAAPHSAWMGSVAAAKVMFDLLAEQPPAASKAATTVGTPTRIGVFVCQCGDKIADIVDTEMVRHRAKVWPGVVDAQVLSFSCSPEAASTIQDTVDDQDLDAVVLAACSCCSIDQVCYSCTYQRVRCKDNLGIFDLPDVAFELVNIREQCAWAHADDPAAATAKATALVAAGVARVRATTGRPLEAPVMERSALVVGDGAPAHACRKALAAQGIAVQQVAAPVAQVRRTGGRYEVVRDGTTWQGAALVLAPKDEGQAADLLATLEGVKSGDPAAWDGPDTNRPGIFYCDPAQDLAGAAAAVRVIGWLGRNGRTRSIAAVVDAARCRACNTCVEVCDFRAPELVGQEPKRTAWIDPAICTGCGTCAAHCPSGAITAGYSTDAQLEAMLEQIVREGW